MKYLIYRSMWMLSVLAPVLVNFTYNTSTQKCTSFHNDNSSDITNIPRSCQHLPTTQHILHYLPATTGGVVLPVGIALGGVLDPGIR